MATIIDDFEDGDKTTKNSDWSGWNNNYLDTFDVSQHGVLDNYSAKIFRQDFTGSISTSGTKNDVFNCSFRVGSFVSNDRTDTRIELKNSQGNRMIDLGVDNIDNSFFLNSNDPFTLGDFNTNTRYDITIRGGAQKQVEAEINGTKYTNLGSVPEDFSRISFSLSPILSEL